MQLTGKITKIFDQKDISAKFRKRELVLTTEEQFPQLILVEFTQDRIALMEGLSVGEQVTISINIRGREWNSPSGDTKYFVSIQGWKIERGAPGAAPDEPMPDDSPFPAASDDDIPF